MFFHRPSAPGNSRMRIRLLLTLLLVAFLAGCGSDSTSSDFPAPLPSPLASPLSSPSPAASVSVSPGSSPLPSPTASPVTPPLATLTVQLLLEQLRVVQAYVETVRLVGLDAAGRRVYGPVERPKQATLVFADVPSNVVEIQLDFLIGPPGDQTVTGVFRGPVNLTSGAATINDPDFVDVNTVQSLSVTGPATLARGAQAQLVATGTFTNGKAYDLTSAVRWASSASSVATVSLSGQVTAVAPGTATLTARRDNLVGSLNLTVSPATLVSLAVSPASASIPAFTTQAFTARGTFSDNTTQDLTTQVTWSSSKASVASISPTGLATATAPGSTVITARQAGVSGNATLSVSGAAVVNAVILPANPRVPLFSYQTFTLNATLSDNSVRDLTAFANWSSSEPSIAAVTQPGELRALNEGTAMLTASLGAVLAQTNVTAFIPNNGGGGGGGVQAVRFAAAVNFPLVRSPNQMTSGNFTASGRPDLATANTGTDDVAVLLNTGGAFGAASFYGAGLGAIGIAAAAFDGDGFLDLLTADQTGDTVSILLGDGAGAFSIFNSFTAGAGSSPRGVVVADFNGAGGLDAATANSGSGTGTNGLSVLLNDGTGNLLAPVQFDTGGGPFGIASGLFNGDAFLDLAVACASANAVTVRFGNGAGAFPTFVNVTVGASPRRILARDLNGDGRLDFATADSNGNTISLAFGDGAGGFAPAFQLAVGSGPNEIAAGDFNGDSLLDLAVANSASNSVSILTGNGSGSYTPAATLGVGTNPTTIVVADFNGDGRLDLATGNLLSNNVSLLLQLP